MYSVYHSGGTTGLGRAAGPFATEQEACSHLEACFQVFGPVEVLADTPPSEAEEVYRRAYVAARHQAERKGLAVGGRLTKNALKVCRRKARLAVRQQLGAAYLDHKGNPTAGVRR